MVGTVNIGGRQQGRIQAKSVISCEPTRIKIKSASTKLLSDDFQSNIKNTITFNIKKYIVSILNLFLP